MDIMLVEFVKTRIKQVKIFIIVFYIVGIYGIIIPFTFPLFIKLVPFAIILSLVAILFFHSQRFDLKSTTIFSLIFLLCFLIELAGVNTGLIFGHYSYGKSLGLQVFNTPVIIGINWLLLLYLSCSVVDHLNIHWIFKVVLSSLLMVLYDLVMEQVAPGLDMWRWQRGIVPMQNYIVWFLISLFLCFIFKMFDIKTKNPISVVLFVSQFLFFSVIYILK